MSYYLKVLPKEKELEKAIAGYAKEVFNQKIDDKLLDYQRKRLDYIKTFINKKVNILDIGCGNGVFMRIAKENGFSVAGMDMAKAIVTTLQKKGFTMFDDLKKIPNNSFDLITLFDVIEHVPNPKKFINDIRSKLKSTGVLCLTTPNSRGMTANILPFVLLKTTTSDHPVLYNPTSLQSLLKREKFSIVDVRTDILLSWWYTKYKIFNKMMNKLIYTALYPLSGYLFSKHLGDNIQI
ncbi:MAG: class I SAM-dependent methyltransferase, partial [Candidatus Levyibacteriota bacterium]